MKNWSIILENINANDVILNESIFTLGNGCMGRRANFQESYSGDTLEGSYLAGVYYPDRTQVGWWKNGYPPYYARIANTPNWSRIKCRLRDEELDLYHWEVRNFQQELNMKEGVLLRSFDAISPRGTHIAVKVEEFMSMEIKEASLIRYSIRSINFTGRLSYLPTIDGNVKNVINNYGERFWNMLNTKTTNQYALLTAQTKRSDFYFCAATGYRLNKNEVECPHSPIKIEKYDEVGFSIGANIVPNDTLTLYKYTAVLSSLYHNHTEIEENAISKLTLLKELGWDTLRAKQVAYWKTTWAKSDLNIEGDDKAQLAIRYNIFQLKQNFGGDDPRLNIAPRGFSGEKYGGCTYWNTEACCFDYYLLTAPRSVARNLLLYRYNHLPKAITNGKKLGFSNGAALFPMVTINGEECHNEWEITFEEIHRNGAIVYAIHDYVGYTNDHRYLIEYGFEVLVAICRFWAQRVNYSERHKKYMLLGVTGPNNYENNVDNNWYTNYMCKWSLKYTCEVADWLKREHSEAYSNLREILQIRGYELDKWCTIEKNMYLPYDDELGIFVQHDGYLNKELRNVSEIPIEQVPIEQHWSWDRILRSCYIKQADVMLGIYFFPHQFSPEELERNYTFYEPKTVHESSLSPFVHSILASRMGNLDLAYHYFMKSACIDLDNINHNSAEGIHIVSMSGSWLSIVKGFGAMEIINNKLHIAPQIPSQWSSYSFKIDFNDNHLHIYVDANKTIITNKKGESLQIHVFNIPYWINKGDAIEISLKHS